MPILLNIIFGLKFIRFFNFKFHFGLQIVLKEKN